MANTITKNISWLHTLLLLIFTNEPLTFIIYGNYNESLKLDHLKSLLLL